jgi:cell division protein FtsB
MEVTTHIDLTLPLWGMLVAAVFGAYYILQMNFELASLKKDVELLRKQSERLHGDIADLKDYIIKNFTTDV